MAAPFDEAKAVEQTGGDKAFCVEIVEAFLQEMSGLLDEIDRAMRGRDAAMLRRAAHTLKGSVDVLAAEPTRQAAWKLEHLGRDANWEEAPAAVDELKAELDRLLPSLKQFVNVS